MDKLRRLQQRTRITRTSFIDKATLVPILQRAIHHRALEHPSKILHKYYSDFHSLIRLSKGFRHSTRSVTQSQIEEEVENGRRYCNHSYLMPADEAEQTRLAIAHQAYLAILDGQMTLASIPKTAERILDIGTSTGDWPVAVAERFPKAEVIATDITTAFQPSSAPPNLFLELDDAQDEWTYTDPFDFIHIRGLMGAFADWSHIYAEARKHLKTGGSLEVADFGTIHLSMEPANSYLSIWNGAMKSAAEAAGTPVDLEHLKRPLFEAAGLSVTKAKSFNVPLGAWSPDPRKKVAAKMALIAALEGLEALSLRLFTRHLSWTEDAVRDLCEEVKGEVMAEGAKAWASLTFVAARKIL